MKGLVTYQHPVPEHDHLCYDFCSWLKVWQKDDLAAMQESWRIENHRDAYPGGGLLLITQHGWVREVDVKRAAVAFVHSWLVGKIDMEKPSVSLGLIEVLGYLHGWKENGNLQVRQYFIDHALLLLWKAHDVQLDWVRKILLHSIIGILGTCGIRMSDDVREVVRATCDTSTPQNTSVLRILYAEEGNRWSEEIDTIINARIRQVRRLLAAPNVRASVRYQALRELYWMLKERHAPPFPSSDNACLRQEMAAARKKARDVLLNQGVIFAANAHMR
jgi:hypothetical protein